MPLFLAELRHRATAFAHEYAATANERSESQSFWRDFLDVFGQNRRRVAQFEVPVKKEGDGQGFIDMFIPGKLLVEQKTMGRDLTKATQQARDYFPGLPDYKLPRYVLVSDFARFRLHDLDTGAEHQFGLPELPENLHLFSFLSGYQSRATASAAQGAAHQIASTQKAPAEYWRGLFWHLRLAAAYSRPMG